MKKTCVAAAVLLLLAASLAVAGGTAENRQGRPMSLVVATAAVMPPMETINEDKQIVGFDVDLMNAAAKAGGFKVEFKNTAWGACLGAASLPPWPRASTTR